MGRAHPRLTSDGVQPLAGRGNARRDIGAVAVATLAFFAFACWVELSEALNRWASGYERWQLDELPLTLLALAAGLAWFGWRRLTEWRTEALARERAERAHASLLEQNRLLTRRLLSLQEEERRALAHELHDELGQYCAAIKADAAFLARHVGNGSAAHAESARSLAASADCVQQGVRTMLRQLRPSALDDLGLAACLQQLADNWTERHAIDCEFVAAGALEDLDETLNITTYRIVQECLTNIARHSDARTSVVRVARESRNGAGGALTITVDDNGKGLGAAQSAPGLGLLGMAERANAVGGRLRLDRSALGGLRVEAVLPLPRSGSAP